MKTSSIVTTLIVIIVVIGVGYYFFMMPQGASAPTTDTTVNTNPTGADTNPSATPTPPTSTANPLVLTANSATLGSYIAATTNGMTLYTYSPDTLGVSNCSGSCAVNWPPYTIAPGTTLAGGADMHGTFGTVTRADGSTQLTYNGDPLYFYIKDKKSGDTIGQGVGGVWYIVKP